jgi:hypothetical protein
METTVKNIGLLLMGILLMMIWGFSHTFFKLFTSFHNSNIEPHIYGIAFLLWGAMLVAHAFFSQNSKAAALKIIKNSCYLLAPLVMFAMYCAAKEQYSLDILQVTEAEAIARQTICLPNILAFGILYILAMLNKERAFNYTRYIFAATMLLVGIGLSHLFITYIHFPFSMSVTLSFIIIDLVLLTLMMNDKIYGLMVKPYLVSLIVVLATHLIWFCMANTSAWQSTAGKFAQLFF